MKAIVYEKTFPCSQCFVNLCLDVQLWIYIHLRMYISVYLQAYVRTHMRAVTHTWPCTQVVQEFLLEFYQRPKKRHIRQEGGEAGAGQTAELSKSS